MRVCGLFRSCAIQNGTAVHECWCPCQRGRVCLQYAENTHKHSDTTSLQCDILLSRLCCSLMCQWQPTPRELWGEKTHPAHPQVLSLSGTSRHQWSCSAAAAAAAERWLSTRLQEDSWLSVYYSRMATSLVSVRTEPCYYRDLINVS